MAKPAQWIAERFALPATPLKVDREKCIVYGVRVCGPVSRNGRVYPKAWHERHLIPVLENAPCNWGHQYLTPGGVTPNPDPPPNMKVGRHVNPRFEADGTLTDLKYNPKHQHIEQFLWAAENDPGQLAFSIHAAVNWLPEPDSQGHKVAESLADLASVDIVGAGGTTNGIFEADLSGATMPTDPKTVAAELTSGDLLKSFLTSLFQSLPAGVDDAAKQDAIDAVQSWLDSGTQTPPDNATGDQAAPAMESLRKRGRVGRWAASVLDKGFVAEAAKQRKDWAVNLCKSEGLSDQLRTDVFVETVAEAFGNDARAKALIADRKQFAAAGKAPRSSDAGGGEKTLDQIVAEAAWGTG